MAKGKYWKWIEEEGLLTLTAYAREGLVDAEIAAKVGINVGTLYEWMNRFPEIANAIKKGKAPVDTKVENTLLKRALGYEVTEETKELRKDPDTGEHALVVTKRVTKHVPPDTTAQIFWLKNRRPDKWRDKPVEAAGSDDNTIRVVFDPFDGGDSNGG